MTTLNVNFDDAIEPQPLPKGKYPVQITAAEEKASGQNSKNPGSPMIVVTAGFTGPSPEEQNAPTVRHFISLPHDNDEAKSANFKVLLLKRFMHAFGLQASGNADIDVEQLCFDLVGREATLEVSLSEPNETGDVYNGLVIPRIPNEPVTGRGGKRG
jgi:hypothetical protein